jgi:hypothetical protein
MSFRRSSIVQERFIPDQDPQDNLVRPGRRRKGSYRKEVMMPAWQFFSLIRMLETLIYNFQELT